MGNVPLTGHGRRRGTERKRAECSTGPSRPRRGRPTYGRRPPDVSSRSLGHRDQSHRPPAPRRPCARQHHPAHRRRSRVRRTISTVLTGVGYTVTVSTDPTRPSRKVADHQLVIIDVVEGKRTGVDICREIRATPALSSIPVLCVGQSDDVEERIRFLEAGADDVMARPFDARELEARVEALLLRFQRSKDLGSVISTDGIIVAKIRRTSPSTARRAASGPRRSRRTSRWRRPSCGRTGSSSSTSTSSSARSRRTSTSIRRQTIADVVRDEAAMREPELLRTYATNTTAGSTSWRPRSARSRPSWSRPTTSSGS